MNHFNYPTRYISAMTVLALGATLVLGAPSAGAPPADAARDHVQAFVPDVPTVSAAIPWTSTSTPFSADGVYREWPMPDGYVEREYFISGTANIYEYAKTGVDVVAPCPASVAGAELPACTGLPYTTRILVAAPKNPKRFSGNVWVNPLNPSAGYDYRADWDRTQPYHVREGNAYVMWTSKSVAVAALKDYDFARYEELNWPYDPATPGANSSAYDGITYDIAGQIGRLLKQNGPTSPLHRYDVDGVFETGFSQDGWFTFTQANVFHNLMRMPSGGGVYDGYLPQGAGSQTAVSLNMGLTPDGNLDADDPRQKMGRRDAPVIKVNTETEVAGFLDIPVLWRRSDSDNRNDRYREWEVPGASHDDEQSLLDPSNMSLYGVVGFPSDCAHADPPNVSPTDLRYGYVANAAADALVRWSKGKTKYSPPQFSRIRQTDLRNPTKETIVRDRFGNARGGVRTPQVTVPRSTFSVIDGGPDYCWSIGWSTPLSDTTLASLYKNSRDYKHQFSAAARKAVSRGFWLKEDARQAVKELARLP